MSKNKYDIKVIIAEIIPKLLIVRVKIKSVIASGKYKFIAFVGVLTILALPIVINALSICIPPPLWKFVILSIR